jgi:hypothetical protein
MARIVGIDNILIFVILLIPIVFHVGGNQMHPPKRASRPTYRRFPCEFSGDAAENLALHPLTREEYAALKQRLYELRGFVTPGTTKSRLLEAVAREVAHA